MASPGPVRREMVTLHDAHSVNPFAPILQYLNFLLY